MGEGAALTSTVDFEKDPSRYRHWRVEYDGPIASVIMDVDPDGGLVPGYELKLNSYDLGVDLELADIVRRTRFEHPEVRVVLISSGNDRAFCAGANISMLGQSSHAWKVNFCKFTNETRCEIEDATDNSAQTWIAACNGTTAGGGYELALACKEIYLQDDGNSAVSLPEVPLLGVLPGTGGLTRLVDKRKIRRDLADVFSTTAEGIRGKKAVQWKLVDGIFPRSKFAEQIRARAQAVATELDKQLGHEQRVGVKLGRLHVEANSPGDTGDSKVRKYSAVELECDPATRIATLTVRGPTQADLELVQKGPEAIHAAGDSVWALRAYRELDDALLHIRINHLDIGLVLVKVQADVGRTIAYDNALLDAGDAFAHPRAPTWFAREIVGLMARTLRRMDLTSRSFFAIGEAGTGWGGNLLELALASDRFYILDDSEHPVEVGVSPMNWGALPMSHGQHRLEVRFYGEPDKLAALRKLGLDGDGVLSAEDADEAGLVTVRLDEIDWEDDTRVAIEERASLSPDALTGMEANLRFPGAENCDSKIFARLTAWQNWIFIRPNATGPEGALTLYGRPERPRFDWQRV